MPKAKVSSPARKKRSAATPPKRLNREEQNALRHQQILEATWELFCEHGYEALKIDQVAERAGVSRMPVYYIFGDKQNLFLALWKSEVDKVLSAISEAMKEGASLRENLRAMARLTAEGHAQMERNPGENLFFVVQTIALSREDIDEKLTAISKSINHAFANIIEISTLDKAETLRGTPDNLGKYLYGLVNGLSTVRFQTGRIDLSEDHLLDMMLAIVLDIHP